MDKKQGFIQAVETMKEFDIWSNQYLLEDMDLITSMLKVSYEKLEEEQNKEEINKEELKFCNFRINFLTNAKKVTDTYKEQLTPVAEDMERLEDLQWEALNLLHDCGLKKLAKIPVGIDMRENDERLAYYYPKTKKILIHKYTLDNYSDSELVSILMHEYIHAYLDINFSHINERIHSDESIFFACMIDRVNKKLKRMNTNYRIWQNGYNDLHYRYYFKYKFNGLTDLRKSISTIKKEIISTVNEVIEQYQTILLLEQEIVNEYRRKTLTYGI